MTGSELINALDRYDRHIPFFIELGGQPAGVLFADTRGRHGSAAPRRVGSAQSDVGRAGIRHRGDVACLVHPEQASRSAILRRTGIPAPLFQPEPHLRQSECEDRESA